MTIPTRIFRSPTTSNDECLEQRHIASRVISAELTGRMAVCLKFFIVLLPRVTAQRDLSASTVVPVLFRQVDGELIVDELAVTNINL